MLVKYTFVFNRKKQFDSNGEGLIEMVCTLKRNRKYVSTKIRIKPRHWNQEKREVRRSHLKHEHINGQLQELETKYYDFEANRSFELRRQEDSFQLEDFNLIHELDKDHNKCFIKFVDNEIKVRTRSGKFQKRTLMGYTTFYNNLKLFRSTITFHSMDNDFAKDLNVFIAENFKNQGTKWTFEKVLKTFLTAVQNDSLMTADRVLKLKSKFKSRKVVKQDPEVITIEDFKKLRNFKPDSIKRQIVLDAFLIGCYTGLRISDVRNLSFEEIIYDSEGNMSLKVNVIKGGEKNNKKALVLPIYAMFKFNDEENSEPVKILEKYIDHKKSLRALKKGDRLFFDVSEPFMNRYLKDVATACNFEISRLTFHHSRNIFARLLHHHMGHSISLVKELLQHSDIKQTMVYETSNEREREQILKDANWDLIK